MWLLPAFARLSRLALGGFYRLEIAGPPIPATGPLLLVANHPNSLLDPAGVAAAAGRPVRFLAKAPLFSDPRVGWLVRASGAVPVFRPPDDPAQTGRNAEVFRAVEEALAGGDAVGIFPEGISHSAPALAPLRTGAARIALGAAQAGAPPTLLPVGLCFREKGRFRSAALVLVGEPVPWEDLQGRGSGDAAAVRELTARMERALGALVPGLERWDDAPLVEGAEAIHAAEFGGAADPAERTARLAQTAAALRALRSGGDPRWADAARQVRRHIHALRILGMTPAELRGAAGAGVAAEWVARQVGFFALGAPLAAAGAAAYWIPFRLTGWLTERARPEPDVRATHKLLLGVVLHAAWTVLLALAAVTLWGWRAGLAALLLLPVCGAATLWVAERWEGARGELHRFGVRVRRHGPLLRLRARQREIAERLHELWRSAGAG